MTPTAIYLRVSTDDQADAYGIQAQRLKCLAMATIKDWHVDDDMIFVDDGYSGTLEAHKRPELARLIALAHNGKITNVIIGSLDRLGRKTQVILDLVDELSRCNVNLVSCKEAIDTTTPTGRFVVTVFAGLAELERCSIIERTSAGRDARATVDGEKGGRVPYGYQRVDGEINIHEPHAAVVREIFRQRNAGNTLAQIAAHLNTASYRTARGAQWSPSTLHYILANADAYAGGPRNNSPVHWPAII